MATSNYLKLLIEQAQLTPWLEWIAIVAAIAEVLLAKANKVLLYPAGLISTAIYMWLFLRPETRLYADAILNIYYFTMSIYGWILWQKRKNGTTLKITTANKTDWLKIIAGCLGGWALLYVLLTRVFPSLFSWYVVSDVAVWDAFISATAWVGMWLLAKRKVENWLLLNLSNLVAIPVYVYKGMPFTAALTLFLFIVAIFGYLAWTKQIRSQNMPA